MKPSPAASPVRVRPVLGLKGNDPRRPIDITSEKPTPGKVIVLETVAEESEDDNSSVLVIVGLAVLALFALNR